MEIVTGFKVVRTDQGPAPIPPGSPEEYTLDPPHEAEADVRIEPVTIVLETDVRLWEKRRGGDTLLYKEDPAFGKPLLEALAAGWCRLLDSNRADD
jgi:hypothetical protein